MRTFIVLCLVAAACADKLGYNYRPVDHSDFGLSFKPGGLVGHVSQGVVGGSHGAVGGSGSLVGFGGAGSDQGFGTGGFNFGLGHGVGGSSGGVGSNQGFGNGGFDFGLGHGVGGSSGGVGSNHGFGNGGLHYGLGHGNSVVSGSNSGSSFPHFGAGGSHAGPGFGNSGGVGVSGPVDNNGGASYAPQVQLEKEFYTFTANENDFSVPHIENQIASSAKKGLRVIFIKGPESNGLENAAVSLAKHIAEQKTAIYVLQKQADLSTLSHKLNTINSNVNHKPEVHFVKYRTPEDAVNAQKAIQSQYDSLGGVSNNINGGEAPVLNFASKSPGVSHGSPGSVGPSGSVGSSVSPGLSGTVGSSGPALSSGTHGSSGTVGSPGTIGSSVTLGSSLVGSLGSSGDSSLSNTYIPPSAPSSSYLPA